MTTLHFSGFPRVGAFRELKFAQEKYWRKEISEQELLAVAKDLREKNWKHQAAANADFVAAGDYLCFCEENQGVVMWAIRKEDLANPNPPVWGNYGTETNPDWIQETDTLSDFWLYIAIYNGTLGGLPYNANAMGGWDMEGFEVPEQVISYIEKQYTELTSLSWKGQRTFTDANFQIVITLAIHRDTNRATAIFIGSAQRELFDTLLDAMENFGLQWDYTSYDDES